MPQFSVIIPLFNKEKFIAKTIESLLLQTFDDFEILIINDGSTDKSEEKVKEFKDSRIRYFYKENKGVSAARNFGIENAVGNFVAFLDSDDYWFPHFLEEINTIISDFSSYSIFSCAIELQNCSRNYPANYSVSKKSDIEILDYFKASLLQSILSGSSAVIKKDVFKTIGNFDTSLKTDEDTALWIKIGLKYPIVFSWKVGARYNYDPNGLSKNWKNIAEKADFSEYTELEKTNLHLHRFLNLHRLAIAFRCRAFNNREFNRFEKLLDYELISLNQKILLKLPSIVVKKLFVMKAWWERKNRKLLVIK